MCFVGKIGEGYYGLMRITLDQAKKGPRIPVLIHDTDTNDGIGCAWKHNTNQQPIVIPSFPTSTCSMAKLKLVQWHTFNNSTRQKKTLKKIGLLARPTSFKQLATAGALGFEWNDPELPRSFQQFEPVQSFVRDKKEPNPKSTMTKK